MKNKPAPTKTTEAKPELVYVPEGELPKVFLLYSSEGRWRAKDGTYRDSVLGAGTFAQAEADELEANVGDTPITLERAIHEATRTANPVIVAAIAALGSR